MQFYTTYTFIQETFMYKVLATKITDDVSDFLFTFIIYYILFKYGKIYISIPSDFLRSETALVASLSHLLLYSLSA